MKAENFIVECPRCKNEWALNPRKWRNLSSILRKGKKLLHCPFCNKLIILSRRETREVLKNGIYDKRAGFGRRGESRGRR